MLRESDALAYLRLKSRFQESDHNAVYADGRVLPVLFRTVNGVQQCVVEIGDQLFEAAKVSGFQRFEKIAEPVAPAPPPLELTPQEIFNERMREAREANLGANELSLRLRVSEQLAKEALAERQQNRQGQQDLAVPDKWASFAAAAKRARNSK